MSHINLFQTVAEFESAYTNDYKEPWVSYTTEGSGLTYNKKSGPEPPQPVNPYASMYLTAEITNPGGMYIMGPSVDNMEIYYNLNDEGWTQVTDSTGLSVYEGDIVQFKGYNFSNIDARGTDGYEMLMGTDCEYNLYGNIMSLVDGDNFVNLSALSETVSFDYMFESQSGLMSIENLVLPATVLSEYCYNGMFFGCSNLTTVPNDLLPATALTEGCYNSMFNGCTSLTTAPELLATTLVFGCYLAMFAGCTSLNYIKCLATDISASDCTYNWVNGVASAGTFVKNPSMSSWTTGDEGIPSNWTVEDAS